MYPQRQPGSTWSLHESCTSASHSKACMRWNRVDSGRAPLLLLGGESVAALQSSLCFPCATRLARTATTGTTNTPEADPRNRQNLTELLPYLHCDDRMLPYLGEAAAQLLGEERPRAPPGHHLLDELLSEQHLRRVVHLGEEVGHTAVDPQVVLLAAPLLQGGQARQARVQAVHQAHQLGVVELERNNGVRLEHVAPAHL
eukprot:4761305-Pyramimonas_sp.AAC.2